ncbi:MULTISPECIES: TolC family outer membrane protein [Pseudomonas]|uniref:Channel protein TolC n=1 Tax=Pseudomonas moraviensis TaxID=321662 RepID=A0A2A2PFB0_9PSED|nr:MULTISPECIES: TolC family outer membrane protein [Pseudomonas]PAW49637.1 channel protein TolC [Pseudomonas moraviensis]PAW54142.1 channel protein TolC [Pseudomonas moraviensis]QXE09654.1 TolC family outer membrane protein [Pseudomonas sp. AN-B15]
MQRIIGVTVLLVLAQPVPALDLRESWNLMQFQGPTYLSAGHEREAALENRAIGKAGLLPKIGITAFDNHINGTQKQPDFYGNNHTNDLNYASRGATLQLRQPLFNKQKMAEYRQGQYQAEYGNAVFDGKAQDSAVRLAGRYFDVLLAHETAKLAAAKLNALNEQVASTQRRRELGDGTVTDVDEAVARRDLAQAELIEAQDSLVVARRQLQEYIGEAPEQVATLQETFPTPPLQPNTLQEWIIRAGTDNPSIRARRLNVNTADEEVAKAKAGHWPTLDLVLGYTAADSETLSTQNQRNRYTSAGVELNIPLYSGGYVSARARQSVATRDQAEEDLNATREEIISGTTREFRSVQSGEARIHALEKAVMSSERSLMSSKKGFLAGSSTNIDILNAQEQIFTARRDLFEAKLRYLLARLRLAADVGALGDDDIENANAYLGPRLTF